MQLGGLLNSPWAMNLGTKTSCLLLRLAWGWEMVSDCEGLRGLCQDVSIRGGWNPSSPRRGWKHSLVPNLAYALNRVATSGITLVLGSKY